MIRHHSRRSAIAFGLPGAAAIVCVLALAPCRGVTAESQSKVDDPEPTEEIVLADQMEIAFYARASARNARLMRAATLELCARVHGHPVRSYGPRLPPERLDWLCNGTPLRFMSGVQMDGAQVDFGFICNAKAFIEVRYNTPRIMGDQAQVCVPFVRSGESEHEIALD